MDPWRVGILFSRSGITGVTESEHFFGTALAIEEINAAGGVLGRMIEPVVYDPKADNDAYRLLARKMLTDDEVSVIFGCSMSGSRKAVLPIVERHNGLLWYPSIYEGFEYSENILYTGATLNQNTFALADFMIREYGRRVFIVGSDYIYPRESNRVMRDLLQQKGGEVIAERYVPLQPGGADVQAIMDEILRLKPDVVFSTIVGQSAQEFYRLYAAAGIDRTRHPIASLTMAETEIRVIGAEHCSGHILAATYFEAVDNETNHRFVAAFKRRFGADATTSMWSQTAYAQVHLFARALGQAGSMETHRLSQAALSAEYESPEGNLVFDRENRHVWLTPRIGVADADGQFEIAWGARFPVQPDPYLAAARYEEPWLQG